MLIDLTDTTTRAIHDALTRARDQLGGPTTGVVLNLIIMTDEAEQHDAIRAASQAGREHPCRILGVIARKVTAAPRLDAEIRTGEGAPGQTVLLRLYGPTAQHADSVVVPLLVPDTPVVTWWPTNAPVVPAGDPLGELAQRRVTDAAAAGAPAAALATLAAGYRPGDTDLSWTRATTWRSLLAATLDQPHGEITSGQVCAPPAGPVRARCLRRSRDHRGEVRDRRRRHHDIQARRPDRHAEPSRPAGPAGRPAPQGDRRAAGRGTAQAEPGRDIRRDAGPVRGQHRSGIARAVSPPQVLMHRPGELQAKASRRLGRLASPGPARAGPGWPGRCAASSAHIVINSPLTWGPRARRPG